jgi:hypothetical protein
MPAKAQTEADRNANARRSAFTLRKSELMGPVFSAPAFRPGTGRGGHSLAYEHIMVNAIKYRSMAAKHHRFAGMCRSPQSREEHLRLEKQLPAFADLALADK